MTSRRALVLAGGGIAGIAWETGVLRGIADESPAAARLLLESDVLVGTSAGSTVAAQLGSGRTLDVLFDRQTAEASAEIDPGVDIEAITELFLDALQQPRDGTWNKTSSLCADRGGGAGNRNRSRDRPARGDRPAPAVARLAGPGAAGHRNRHGDRRIGGFRPGFRRRARRRGGGQLCGAGRVAAGHHRGPALHGRRRRQLGQPQRGRRLRCGGGVGACRRRMRRRRSGPGRPPRSPPSAAGRSLCSPTTTRWRPLVPIRWIRAAASARRWRDARRAAGKPRRSRGFLASDQAAGPSSPLDRGPLRLVGVQHRSGSRRHPGRAWPARDRLR